MFPISEEAAAALALTPEKEATLRNLTIDQQSPGTLLSDFQTLLDFVHETNPTVTPKHILQMKFLAPLNERLIRPLQHGMTRPQQKAFPHINGLFMLLRASGLTLVNAAGKTPRLQIDESTYETWQALNPTERYFILFETWLLRSSPEVVGESRGFFRSPYMSWRQLFLGIKDNGAGGEGGESLTELFRFSTGLHTVALLELFGLLSIDVGPVVESEGWQIERLQRTPLGDALLAALHDQMTDIENLFRYDSPEKLPAGEFQPLLQPYFLEWQKNLTLSEAQFQEGLYIFKVSLRKSLWRRIAIPAMCTLDELSDTILAAYDFDGDHLHEFIYTSRTGTQEHIYHPYMEEDPQTTDVLVGDLPILEGTTIVYHYDFGASWRFKVTVEKINADDGTIKESTIIESHGKAPDEYPDYDDEW